MKGYCWGLEALLELGRKKIVVQSDSQLLVRQLNGEYRVKDEKLKVLHQGALALLRQFDSYRAYSLCASRNEQIGGPVGQSRHRRRDKTKNRGLKWI